MRAVPSRVWCGRWLLRCCRRCCVGSVAAVLCNGFVDEGCSAVVTRRFGKDANGLWKVCVARPENVGAHGGTHGEHVDMSPQEAQARNERELGVTVTAFSSAKKKGPVKGATRLENIFIGRDGARVKALLGELDNFDYDTNSFVHERFNEAKEKNDDYPGELDSFVYGRVYEEREWDDEDLRMISTPSSVAFVRGDIMVEIPDNRDAPATLRNADYCEWERNTDPEGYYGYVRKSKGLVAREITREEALWAVGRSDGFRALINASMQRRRASERDAVKQVDGRYYDDDEGLEVHAMRDYEFMADEGKRFGLPDGAKNWQTLTLCAGEPPTADSDVVYSSESRGYAR